MHTTLAHAGEWLSNPVRSVITTPPITAKIRLFTIVFNLYTYILTAVIASNLYEIITEVHTRSLKATSAFATFSPTRS
jgi:hypothetical protein